VSTLTAVSVVHEQVHERASGEEQKRQRAKHVRCVLGNQEECAHGQKAA
jgi:hypothetical protein